MGKLLGKRTPDTPKPKGKEITPNRETDSTLGMVPLIISPIYTLYSGYVLGIPLQKVFWVVKQLRALHPKGFPIIFPIAKFLFSHLRTSMFCEKTKGE